MNIDGKELDRYITGNYGEDGVGEDQLPKIYAVHNGEFGSGMEIWIVIAEDGHFLGSHVCSNRTFVQHDLFDRADRQVVNEAHYPDGFEMMILQKDEQLPADVQARNQALASEYEAAGKDTEYADASREPHSADLNQ